ncbi:phosphotransferase family protein [Haladaptatus cibarius]|uniref:phosphotransferase family protein n=1 Tax=Haladaptatus cibarius TaxID=453847 RepID=UPI000679457C|nr:phosphotransferase family protein [Haladaptatus cibarius]
MTTSEANIDFTHLESYLSAELGEAVTGTEVLRDGLNLSLAISTERDAKAYVLRHPNMLRHTSYINELEQEYEVMQRLRETTVRTPAPVLFCDDESILGDSFFVMTHLDGEAVPLGFDLPDRFRNAKSRARLADNLIDTLAELHSLAVEPFEGVCEQKTPRELVARTTDRLVASANATGHEPPELQSVAKWLRRNAPSKTETALVHGDFRPGNVLFAERNGPGIIGVLDWETAMCGDPRTDLGYLLLRWRDKDDPTPSLDELEARYSNEDAIEQLRERNENGISPFTAKSGSPTRRELVTRYEDETGIQFENERFYRAHAAFSLAVVWEDFHRERIEAGEESDWEPYIDYMLMIAESIARGEFPL